MEKIENMNDRVLAEETLRTLRRVEADVRKLVEFVEEAGEQISKLSEGGLMGMVSGLLGG